MVALLLVAASLGMSNFAASVGIAISGVDGRTRLRVATVFGVFETAMPLLGLLLGRGLAGRSGRDAHWIGAGLLIATGAYALVQAARAARGHGSGDQTGPAGQRTGIALSIDNLAVGFALGTYHVGLLAAALVIGTVSVTMSLAGLELGRRLGIRGAGGARSWAVWSGSVLPSHRGCSESRGPGRRTVRPQSARHDDGSVLPGGRSLCRGGPRPSTCDGPITRRGVHRRACRVACPG
jgi:putative Mn2+ efflux pump MntP